MLACSATMRDVLSNHLIDVQDDTTARKKWHFNGAWDIHGNYSTLNDDRSRTEIIFSSSHLFRSLYQWLRRFEWGPGFNS